MSTYLYECPGCKDQREVVHGMSEDPVVNCGHCEFTAPMRRVLSPQHTGMTRVTSDSGLSSYEENKFKHWN